MLRLLENLLYYSLTAEPQAEYQPIEEDISDEEGEDNIVIPGGGPGGMFPGFPGGRGRGFPPGGMPFPGGGMPIGKNKDNLYAHFCVNL